MSKAKEISALYKDIKQQMGKLVSLCHEVEDHAEATEAHAEVTADAYQRGYETAKHECEDCPKQAYTDAIRKEAYQQGHKDGYNKHDTEKIRKQGYDKGLDDLGNALRLLLFQYSNYTLQELFGYDTARAVVEHYEGSEIVARIRCYEGGVKQDVETIRKEAYDKAFEDAEQVAESGKRAMYQKGLSDAWEAARKICTNWVLSDSVLSEIFGMDKTIDDIMKENTASEVIAKIQAYEQEKEEQIQVGDEVIGAYTGGGKTEPFVVIRKIQEIDPAYYFGIYSKSGEFCQGGLKLKKTGRHFPEIAEVLRKMKEKES